MILLILGLALLVLIVSLVLRYGSFKGKSFMKHSWEADEAIDIVQVVSFITAIVMLIAALIIGIEISIIGRVDDKIAMYEEENARIESQMETIVEHYMEYESGVFSDITPESSMTYVTLYPELKADTLVQEQMKVHIENNNIIKELKRDKIDCSVLRWWLYFGG